MMHDENQRRGENSKHQKQFSPLDQSVILSCNEIRGLSPIKTGKTIPLDFPRFPRNRIVFPVASKFPQTPACKSMLEGEYWGR